MNDWRNFILKGYIECPEHGKQIVRVDTEVHNEFFARKTALCPKCKRRLVGKFEVKK